MAVTVTGTIIGDGDPRMASDIVAGGKTIILTLTGDTWVASGATFNAERQSIIDGLQSSTDPANGWNAEVLGELAVTDVVRTSDTVVTITLPAVAAYALTTQHDEVSARVSGSALTSGGNIIAMPLFRVHPVRSTSRRATAGWSTSGNYLTGPVFSQIDPDGLFVSFWLKQADDHKTMPWQLGKAGVLSHHRRFITAIGGAVVTGKWWNPTGETGADPGFDSGQDHTGDQAAAAVNYLTARWQHISGAWLPNSDKYIWVHGGNEGFDSVDATPNTPTSSRIGVRMDDADGLQVDDEIAELSVWDVSALSIGQIRELKTRISTPHNGHAPHALDLSEETGKPWSGKLLCLVDLDFTSPTWTDDLSGEANHYTEVGTLTQGDDYPPVSPYIGTPAAGPVYAFPGVG
jgi:hypothetical protein